MKKYSKGMDKMKLMRTEDAVGQVLCHDITQIIKGVTKDAVFRKGHIITEEDIPVLLSVGKDHIYIWENNENMLHENDAAKILYDMCANEHMTPSEIKEGKIELIAECDGLLKVDTERLNAVNALGEMMIACRHGNFPVKKGDKIAGTRIIPLVIEKEKMERAKKLAGEEPIFELIPFKKKKAAIVNTGNEVFYGRIKDTFTPVIIEKLKEYGAEVVGHVVSDDNHEHITAAIQKFLDEGVDMVLCTGGMSVDPIEIVKDWVNIAEDGYLTLRFRTRWGNNGVAHFVNLFTGVNPDDPYEVEFRHNAFGDVNGVWGDALVAFRLSDLPDTEGKTVKLTLKYKSFSGEKSIQFDYCSRKAAGSTNIAEKPAYSSRVK